MRARSSIPWIGLGAAVLLSVAFLGSGCAERRHADDLHPEAFDVGVTVDPARITVGDLVRVEVRAVHPVDMRPVLPSLRGDGQIEVRHTTSERRPVDDDLIKTIQRITLSSFQVGTHHLSTGVVEFVGRDMEPVIREFPVVGFEVVSLLDDEEVGRGEMHPLLEWPSRVPMWVWVLPGVAVIALGLGWLTSYWLRQRRTIVRQPPPPPAHETALNALQLLKSKGYMERNEVEPFYIELSSIVRVYLEDRFDLRAPEQTTEEFIREAAEMRALNAEQKSLVGAFLEQSDLVKFARFHPGAEAMQDAFIAAEQLVQETKQQEEGVGA